MGAKSIDPILRRRSCVNSLAPYHNYVIEKLSGGEGLSALLERMGVRNGLTLDMFLSDPEREKYVKGSITKPGKHRGGYVPPARRKSPTAPLPAPEPAPVAADPKEAARQRIKALQKKGSRVVQDAAVEPTIGAEKVKAAVRKATVKKNNRG